MARAMRASGLANPNAIRAMSRILVLTDSIRPLDRWCSIEARMVSRWATMVRWSLTKRGIRQRRAQPIQASKVGTAPS